MENKSITIPENYEIVQNEFIEDISSIGYILKHKKSGARIAVISNDDTNKLFCITFFTPPENNKGTPHIIEHTVLQGSLKYPAREPFMQLVKGSLNTFLNAMTYPDKTMYILTLFFTRICITSGRFLCRRVGILRQMRTGKS